MKMLLIQAWTVHKANGEYFLPYTHWVYLREIVKYFDAICLLSPTKMYQGSVVNGLVKISEFKNVEVHELPYSAGYIAALKYFPCYIKAYRKFSSFDVSYVRYPNPFGWLQRLFFKDKTRIIHFVGDPMDTFRNNPNLGKLKRWIYTALFLPEHWLYLWACKKAKVYTNGFHLAERLEQQGIQAEALVSSTLTESDFYFDEDKVIEAGVPKIIYVGYLRKAKGVDTVIRSFALLQAKYPMAELTIVGTGESEQELKALSHRLQLKRVQFLGHVDNRDQLNDLLRKHDVFCFASLSEGSPRVILEAMANGLNIVSTPVGALPHIFNDGKDISFADYNEEDKFFERIDQLIENQDMAFRLREKAYSKVRGFTIQKFLNNIFNGS